MTDLAGSQRRAWWALAASAALIVLAYLADGFVAAAVREGLRTFSVTWPLAVEAATRLLAVGLMAGLGWLVFRGPRQRLVGFLMMLLGLYLALWQFLQAGLLANTGIVLPPAFLPYLSPGGLLTWTSSGVAVLGFVELAWPSKVPRD